MSETISFNFCSMNTTELMTAGWQAQQAGDLAQAEQLYRQVLQHDAAHAEALYLLGTVLQTVGRLQEAVASYEKSLQVKPHQPEVYHNIGVACATVGDRDKAIAYYQYALQLKPEYGDAHYSLGIDLAALGRLDEAIASLEQAIRFNPSHRDAYECLKSLLAERDRLEPAPAADVPLPPPGDRCLAWSKTSDECVDSFTVPTQPWSGGFGLAGFSNSSAGLALLGQGRCADAVEAFRRALQTDPDDADTHNNLGIAYRELGRLEESVASYQRALMCRPDFADAYNNLGVSLTDLGRYAEAIGCYEQALRLRPNYVEALNNMGNARRNQHRLDEAIACYQKALSLKPDFPDAYNNLGVALREQDKRAEAAEMLRLAIRFKPDYVAAHLNLAGTLKELGQMEEAAASYQDVLRYDPGNEEAYYFHALLTGSTSLQTAPTNYVQRLFDGYADRFDEELVGKLGYRAPGLLRAAVADFVGNRRLSILDLGCGTGLCGLAFRDLASTLTGVDLSRQMLEKCRQRSVYDQLVQADLTTYLAAEAAQCDLILAADVFIYVGNLARPFAEVSHTLAPGGLFAFTVEVHDGDGFIARKSGRFAHSLGYLRELAARNGLRELAVHREVLRRELADVIEGWVMVLQRPGDER